MHNMFSEAVRDENALRQALMEADVAPMLMVLVQLTGDLSLLDEAAPHIRGAWSFMESVPEPLKQKLRDRLIETLQDYAHKHRNPPTNVPADVLQRMMSTAVGQSVPEEYIPLLVEEIRLQGDTRAVHWREQIPARALEDFKVLVIGGGFSGLCAAIQLQQAGIPFEVLEKNDNIGGTWYENQYPGCGVDTPNHFFSYSFYPYNKWSRHFSQRAEIQGYIEEVAKAYDIRKCVRFGTEVTSATFDETAGRWTVVARTKDGREEKIDCNAVITAVGQLNRPSIPQIRGLDRFKGPKFHTAAWDKSADLAGKRVAMIGTGASAVQAGPTIAPDVARLLIFQRSPHWVMPNENYHKEVSAGMKWALQNIPFYSEWYRFQLFWASSDGFHASLQMDPNWDKPAVSLNAANHAMRERLETHIRASLGSDEELIARCTPSYPPYGKRMLRDNHWYEMLKRDNVALITDRIDHVTENAVVTADGTVHEVDAIVLATGFQAAKVLWPMEITGKNGMTIRRAWGDEDPRAYKGMTVPDFPNLFVTFGPNTNLAHGGSAIFHFECQIHYIMQALRELIEGAWDTMEIRRDVHDAYNAMVDEKCTNMVWAHPGVTNWYKNRNNRVTLTSPWRLVDYWKLTHEFVADEYLLTRLPGSPRNRSKQMAEVS